MESYHIARKEIHMLYADTDMMGVIYHGNYIKWLEIGRNQLIADVGFNYMKMEEQGFYAPVYSLDITYLKSLTLRNQAFIHTWIDQNTGFKTMYGFEIVNEFGEVCAKGTTTVLVVKKENDVFKPVVFKKRFPEWFDAYEKIKKKSL